MPAVRTISDASRVRRRSALEALSLSVPLAAAVSSSSAFLAGTSSTFALLVALAALAVAAAGCFAYRRRNPPTLPAEPDPEPSFRADAAPDDRDAETRWDRLTGVLVALGVVAAVALIAIVTRFVLPLLVVIAFAVMNSSSSLGGFVAAAACTIAVGLVVELGVVAPLGRRWRLDLDEPAGLFLLGATD